ncbi:MAG TPA: precorrin-6A synthase (deacetylating) [Thermoleophilaceae bacterium]|jgi:precorrin-6A synthase
MRRLLLIGIGAGDPAHITVEAIAALNEADVLFVVEKPEERRELVRLREEICTRYIEDESAYRSVHVADPERDRGAEAYRSAVEDWRRRRADAWEAALAAELGPDDTGAFLIWGDPSLYDSTLAVVDDVLARGSIVFEHRVVPGISSVQVLAARFRIPLNRVGGAVQITPGRLLLDGWPAGVDDVVVMLDARSAFRSVAGEGLDIYWGAYLGTPDELLLSGPLDDALMDEIERVRSEARERQGWIMDTYLLRRRRPVRR